MRIATPGCGILVQMRITPPVERNSSPDANCTAGDWNSSPNRKVPPGRGIPIQVKIVPPGAESGTGHRKVGPGVLDIPGEIPCPGRGEVVRLPRFFADAAAKEGAKDWESTTIDVSTRW